MVALRPMTEPEFEAYTSVMWENYAQERARNAGTPIEQERAVVAQQRAELQKDGMRTAGHHYWTVVDDAGAPVGILWVFVDPERTRAFIYDIEMRADQRGKGYGKATLDLLEAEMRPLGVKRIELSVFGDNAVAERLYRRQGYRTITTAMAKDLA
jgi:ribosomal protein S18 acetylase RimI-like enzyme